MRVESMETTIRPAVKFTPMELKNGLVNRQGPGVPNETISGQEKVSHSFVQKAVNKANETMQFHGRSLKFEIHEKTNEIMVKIIDKETKEVIREIPPEKMLDMFANMLELAGLLVDESR